MSCYFTLILMASSLLGDDFLSNGASARSVAAGGTYLGSRDNALDALALNPAGLTQLTAPVFNLSLIAGFARGTFNNAANHDAPLSAKGAFPYGAFGTPLTPHFSLGVAILPQLLSHAKWTFADAPGGTGNVSYGMLNHDSKIVALRTTVGVGIVINRRLRLGVSAASVYNSNRLQTAYVFQSHPALAGLKTLLDLHTRGVGWNGSAGFLLQTSRRLQVGATYTSRTKVPAKGAATGNAGIQFAAIGLGWARPDFRYEAEVDNTLPQSLLAHALWTANSRTRFSALLHWVNWNRAFTQLPVILTDGNNADINALLQSNRITDSIPLHWKDQYMTRFGMERNWSENVILRAGYSYANNPVPASTMMPLNAAITNQTISTGAGFLFGRTWRLDAAYTLAPYARQHSATSLLKAGEYSNSTVRVNTQSVILTVTRRL